MHNLHIGEQFSHLGVELRTRMLHTMSVSGIACSHDAAQRVYGIRPMNRQVRHAIRQIPNQEAKIMDQIKIGKFIAYRRKKQGLSQKQLAEQIDVTDKTISKWEPGSRMPDASMLLKLSQALEIDVNELLAGEEFSSEEYLKRSESNLVNLVGELNEMDKKRKSGKVGTIIGFLCIAFAFLSMVGSSLRRITDIFDLPTLLYLSGIKCLLLSTFGWIHHYFNAWKICASRKALPEKDIQPAVQAVKYAAVLTLTIGGITSSIGIFAMLNYTEQWGTMIAPALAQITLTFFYVAVEETVYAILLFQMKYMLLKK